MKNDKISPKKIKHPPTKKRPVKSGAYVNQTYPKTLTVKITYAPTGVDVWYTKRIGEEITIQSAIQEIAENSRNVTLLSEKATHYLTTQGFKISVVHCKIIKINLNNE